MRLLAVFGVAVRVAIGTDAARAELLPYGVLVDEPPGLPHDVMVDDLTVICTLYGGGDLGPIDLVYMPELYPGDANRDFSFDQLDIVRVLQAGKYLTGESATWGEGDWNGGPGGYPGEPRPSDGLFDQLDIVASLQTGAYLNDPYPAIRPGGVENDEQTSIVYDARNGELALDAPASTELTSLNIDSADSIFEGEKSTCYRAIGAAPGDDCVANNIFMARFGGSFGSRSFGSIARAGLSEEFVANDLTVVGSLDGGGDLGDVDLIYIPEPSTLLLALLGIFGLLHLRR